MNFNSIFTCPDCGKEMPAHPDAPKGKCLNVLRRCTECSNNALHKHTSADGTVRIIRYNNDKSVTMSRVRLKTDEGTPSNLDGSPANNYVSVDVIELPHIRRFDIPSRMCDGGFGDNDSEAWLIRRTEWRHYINLNAARAAEIDHYGLDFNKMPPVDFGKVRLAKILHDNIKPVGHYLVVEYDGTHGASLTEAARLKDVTKAIFFQKYPGTVFDTKDTLIELPYISRQYMPPRKCDGCSTADPENEVWIIRKDEWDCYISLNELLAEEAEASTSDTHSATNSAVEATDTH